MSQFMDSIDDGLVMRESGDWVVEKLDYLERYIGIFESAMRDKFSTRFYIDLLAGPGKNNIRGKNRIVLGSPLISLTTKYPFTDYIFNEYDNNAYFALKTRVSSSPNNSKTRIFNGDCNLVVDKIVNIINGKDKYSLNLAFIDPEGFQVEWSTISKLASVKKMDMLIYYPQKGLNQNLENFFLSKDNCAIDNFFGDEGWRSIYANLKKKNQTKMIHRELINYYMKRLSDLGYVEVLSDDEIGDEPLIRNSQKKAPLYRLLFASKNKLGKDFWQKVTKRNVYGQKQLF